MQTSPAMDGQMQTQSNPRLEMKLQRFATLSSVVVMAFGAWVLSAWAFDIQQLTTLPGQAVVKANTGLCFLLIGCALYLARKPEGSARRQSGLWAIVPLASLACIIGVLSFIECCWGWDVGIDQLLFHAGPEDALGSIRPGLMSPVSALAFALLGPALLLMLSRRPWARWLQQALGMVVMSVSIFGVLDFVVEPRTFHTHIAPTTAMVLLLFSLAVIVARAQFGLGALVASSSGGGALARRLLPGCIVVPVFIGWLRWQGQSAGVFSGWTGLAVMVVSAILLLSCLTIWTALELDRSGAERSKAEESVRRLASIVISSPDAMISKTLDGVITSWNPGAEATYGYSAPEMIGRNVQMLLAPDGVQELMRVMEKVTRGEIVRQYESVRLHKDGHTFPVSLSVSPIKDQDGNIVGVATSVRDITERKQIEEKLRKLSLYSRSLIEASLDPLVTISRSGKITDVNQATEKATGLVRTELIGSDFSDYFTEPDKARQGYEEVFAEGFVRDYSLAIRHVSGQVAEVLYNASVFRNEAGEVEGIFAAARDVTERKRAEQELRLSRERLVLAQKAGHSGTFDWDLRDNSVIWTREAEEVYGLEPGGFGGTYEDWESRVFPEDLPAAKAAIAQSLQTGSYAAEFRIRRLSDGEVRWITGLGIVLFDDNRQPVRMLGLNMDITERKRAEEEIRKLNQELEQRVEARTAQLTAANKELEAFTYSVSHDLRAPLRHIIGFSKLLMEDFGESLAPEAQHHLQRIEQGTLRMGQLVDDLLNLTRVGRREVTLQVTGLQSLVEEVIAGLEPDCAGREVEWKVGSLPFVECDTALMKQVLQNLLSNAVKFTRPRAPAVIEVGQMESLGAPVVYVRDNGVGFSMKYADKLFGVFQRLHRAEDFEGTGVGLATVQRIINKHGGRIWAEAELDKGATFYFTLGEPEIMQPEKHDELIGAKA